MCFFAVVFSAMCIRKSYPSDVSDGKWAYRPYLTCRRHPGTVAGSGGHARQRAGTDAGVRSIVPRTWATLTVIARSVGDAARAEDVEGTGAALLAPGRGQSSSARASAERRLCFMVPLSAGRRGMKRSTGAACMGRPSFMPNFVFVQCARGAASRKLLRGREGGICRAAIACCPHLVGTCRLPAI